MRHPLPLGNALVLALALAAHQARCADPPVTAADITRAVADAAKFDEGQAHAPLLAVERIVNRTHGDASLRTQIERELAALLESDAPLAAKQFACRLLWMIGTDASIPALAKLLAGPDAHAAEAACFAISTRASPAADKALRAALNQAKGPALVAVINLIAARYDAESVGAIAKLARGPDVATAAAATAALGRIASADALAALAQARTDDARFAELEAARELAARGDRAGADRLYQQIGGPTSPLPVRRGALIGRIGLGGPGAFDLVLAALDGKEAWAKPCAIACVPALPGEQVTVRLASRLPDLSPDLQAMLIDALVDRREAAILPLLIKTAENVDATVRAAAFKGLGIVGDASAVPLLIRHLPTDETAAHALRALQGEGVDQSILAGMKAAEGKTRAELIGLLAARQCKAAVADLRAEVSGADPAVSEAAWRALGLLGGHEDLAALIPQINEIKDERARRAAETCLALLARALPDPDRADAICAALPSVSDPAARASLLRVLGLIANDKSLAVVVDALGTDTDVALRVLSAWPDARAMEPLLGVLKHDTNGVHQVLAFNGALRILQGQPSLARYAQVAAFARRPEEKRVLLAALAAFPDRGALEMAAGYLDDPAVKNEAALAAIAIGKQLRGAARSTLIETMRRVVAATDDPDIRKQAQEIADRTKPPPRR